MTIADVARALDIGVVQVRRLDDDLAPIRIGKIKMRLYDPSTVDRVRKERAKRAR